MLWIAAKCEGHQGESRDITHFGWEFRNDFYTGLAEGDPPPSELHYVVQCQCKAQDQKCSKCSTEAWGCHKHHLSCTPFCNCHVGQDCGDSLLLVTPIVGFCNCSMFCCALLCVHSSFAIILMGKRELFTLLVFLVSRDFCVALLHDTTGLSAVCDCGIS